MSAATVESPKKQGRAIAAPVLSSLLNVDAIQAYVDDVMAPLNPETGRRHPMPLPSVIPGVTPMSGKYDDEGRPLQMNCCELNEDGSVKFGSGVVVTEGFTALLEEKLRPRIAQAVHRTLHEMSRSLKTDGSGVVEKRAKVLMPIPDTDW